MPTEQDCKNTKQKLLTIESISNLFEVLTLNSTSSYEDRIKVLEKQIATTKRRIIISDNNYAVPGVHYVIDTGL